MVANMKQVVKGTFPKCALCKHWYDPAGSAIEPASGRGMWKIEPNVTKKCLLKNCKMQSNMI